MQPPGDARQAWASSGAAAAHVFIAELAPALELEGHDARHLGAVLRLRPGEIVTGADGAGRWRRYAIGAVASRAVTLEAVGEVMVEPGLRPRTGVAFALIKGAKPDLVIQKLCELGVDLAIPFTAERSIIRWDAARSAAAVERWRRIAREAALQCRRARALEVAPVTTFAAVVGCPGTVVAEPSAPAGADVARGLMEQSREDAIVVVGPEGGLSPHERSLATRLPQMSLGPHVLRSETAAIVAGAVLTGARWARWQSSDQGKGLL